jgi:predicted nucleic acid-binding protein
MSYLLDTNVISDFYNVDADNHAKIVSKMLELGNADVYVSMLTIYEFEYALANCPDSKRTKIETTIAKIVRDFCVLNLSIKQAKIFGNLKAQYKTLKQINAENIKKHSIDLMIAATALDYDLTIVSADKIYSDVQSLCADFKLENWTL